MPRWLRPVLLRIRELAAERKVRLTLKARRELAGLEPGLDDEDACEVLARLRSQDSAGRLLSAVTGEWMYRFKPQFTGMVLYVKVILRTDCIVISFHEDEGDAQEDQDR